MSDFYNNNPNNINNSGFNANNGGLGDPNQQFNSVLQKTENDVEQKKVKNQFHFDADGIQDVPKAAAETYVQGTETERGVQATKENINKIGVTDVMNGVEKHLAKSDIHSLQYHSNADVANILSRSGQDYVYGREGSGSVRAHARGKEQLETYLEKQGLNVRPLSDHQIERILRKGEMGAVGKRVLTSDEKAALEELQFLRNHNASSKVATHREKWQVVKSAEKDALEGTAVYDGYSDVKNGFKAVNTVRKAGVAASKASVNAFVGLGGATHRNALRFENGVFKVQNSNIEKELRELNAKITAIKKGQINATPTELSELRKQRSQLELKISQNKSRQGLTKAKINNSKSKELRVKANVNKTMKTRVREGAQKTGVKVYNKLEGSKLGKKLDVKGKKQKFNGWRRKRREKYEKSRRYLIKKFFGKKISAVGGFFNILTAKIKRYIIIGLLIGFPVLCVVIFLVALFATIIPDFGFLHSDTEAISNCEQVAINRIWEEQLAYETCLYNYNAATPAQRAYGIPDVWLNQVQDLMVHKDPNDPNSELISIMNFAVYENAPSVISEEIYFENDTTKRKVVHMGYDSSHPTGALLGFAYADRMFNNYDVYCEQRKDRTKTETVKDMNPNSPTYGRLVTTTVPEWGDWFMMTNGDQEKWGIIDADDGCYDMEWNYKGGASSFQMYDETSVLFKASRYRDDADTTQYTLYDYTNESIYKALLCCFYGMDQCYSYDEIPAESPDFAYDYMHSLWNQILEHSVVGMSGSDHIQLTYICGLTNLMKWDPAEYSPSDVNVYAVNSPGQYGPANNGYTGSLSRTFEGWVDYEGKLNNNWEVAQLYWASHDYWNDCGIVFPTRTDPMLSASQIDEIMRQLRAQNVSIARRNLIKTALSQVGRFYYASDDMSYIHDLTNPQGGTDCNGFVSYVMYLSGIYGSTDFYHSCSAYQACTGLPANHMGGRMTHINYQNASELRPGTILSQAGGCGNHTVLYIGMLYLPERGDTSPKPYVVECTSHTEMGGTGSSLNHASWNGCDYRGHPCSRGGAWYYDATDPFGDTTVWGGI